MADLKDYVRENMLNNCSVMEDDINRAEVIHGPIVPILRGKR